MDLWIESGLLLFGIGSFYSFTFQLGGILEAVQALAQGEDMCPENMVAVPSSWLKSRNFSGHGGPLCPPKWPDLSKGDADENLHFPKRKIPTATFYLPKRDLLKYIVMKYTWLRLLDSRSHSFCTKCIHWQKRAVRNKCLYLGQESELFLNSVP